MSTAKDGDTVKVHYRGTLKTGAVFDDSESRGEPIEFTIGSGHIIAGFEEGVIGMSVGDVKEIALEADAAYGPHQPELVVEIPKEQLPDDMEPEVGAQLVLSDPEGNEIVVRITGMSEEAVTVDGNHPLAGQHLTFQVELVEIAS